MSFILDALKKAESKRGAPVAPVADDGALANVAAEQTPTLRNALPAIAVAIAVVSIAIIAWSLGRKSTVAPVETSAAQSVSRTLPSDDTDRVVRPLDREIARRTAPVRQPAVTESPPPQPDTRLPRTPPSDRQTTTNNNTQPGSTANAQINAALTAERDANIPTYNELVLSGRTRLPPMHLDLHVYAADQDRRFVFINNRKYREGGELPDGGVVERITPHGAIVNLRGYRFELVPD